MPKVRSVPGETVAALAVVLALAPVPARSQLNPAISVEQISQSMSSPARARQAGTAVQAPAVAPGQLADPSQSRTAPAQLASRSQDARMAAVPPHLIDACEKARRQNSAPPKGVDCQAILQPPTPATPPHLSPEEALLGIIPADAISVVTTQRTPNLPDANLVARRLGSGDVQGAPIAEAVGAIAQQSAGTAPKN